MSFNNYFDFFFSFFEIWRQIWVCTGLESWVQTRWNVAQEWIVLWYFPNATSFWKCNFQSLLGDEKVCKSSVTLSNYRKLLVSFRSVNCTNGPVWFQKYDPRISVGQVIQVSFIEQKTHYVITTKRRVDESFTVVWECQFNRNLHPRFLFSEKTLHCKKRGRFISTLFSPVNYETIKLYKIMKGHLKNLWF